MDLLVILKTAQKTWERSFSIRRRIEYHFGLDLIIKTPAEIDQAIQNEDFFIQDILQKGKIAYERHPG